MTEASPITHFVANVREPRPVRVGRIARKLIQLSHQLPNERTAKHFLSSCLRFERVLKGCSPFRNVPLSFNSEPHTASQPHSAMQHNGD